MHPKLKPQKRPALVDTTLNAYSPNYYYNVPRHQYNATCARHNLVTISALCTTPDNEHVYYVTGSNDGIMGVSADCKTRRDG